MLPEIGGKVRLRGKSYFLVRLALLVKAHFDHHFPIKSFQEIEQLVGSETTEMPVHQVRYVGLCNPQKIGDLALFQLLLFKNFKHMNSDLGTRQKLVGIFEAQILEDISGLPALALRLREAA